MGKLQPGNGRESRPNCHKNQLITADPARPVATQYIEVDMCVVYLSAYVDTYIFIFIWPDRLGIASFS